nr:hypothetical protein CFP56_43873 [Quercus suber]
MFSVCGKARPRAAKLGNLMVDVTRSRSGQTKAQRINNGDGGRREAGRGRGESVPLREQRSYCCGRVEGPGLEGVKE